eukprot:TRINITY_DN10913_c0_g1_i1.p1 TRINITY_DN10913_c0_g1~~TRINITY_DN10913_c0_g1_i1.p1  ORF type:complete len:179 (+),score=57.47 TRINITY_DN10913_c0_g1_i1:46-582(+)
MKGNAQKKKKSAAGKEKRKEKLKQKKLAEKMQKPKKMSQLRRKQVRKSVLKDDIEELPQSLLDELAKDLEEDGVQDKLVARKNSRMKLPELQIAEDDLGLVDDELLDFEDDAEINPKQNMFNVVPVSKIGNEESVLEKELSFQKKMLFGKKHVYRREMIVSQPGRTAGPSAKFIVKNA